MVLSRFSLALLILLFASTGHVFGEKKSYIVFLGEHSHGPEITEQYIERVTNSHHELLASFLGSKEKAKGAIFYSYTKHINGFAATLEEGDATRIAGHPDVLLVTPNRRRKLHTTHSWDFLSLENNGVIDANSLWKKANYGEDVIIATLDTGVWPESKSFSDKNYGPIPSRWSGACEDTEAPNGVTCNKKLIGAKKYNKGYIESGGEISSAIDTVRDFEGHGTHTLSTAAGNFVPGADFLGLPVGTTKGGAPRARVAAYKVCWQDGCADADVLQAFDDAIYDGVDVISISFGSQPLDYSDDPIAIGAFYAVKENVVVIFSAGNSGEYQTVTNIAPWVITVGASTLDREYESGLQLHNGLQLKGASLSRSLPKNTMYRLVYGQDAKVANASTGAAERCVEGTLDPKKVKGKIVVCRMGGLITTIGKGKVAYHAGAAGMVLCNVNPRDSELIADPHYLPAVYISFNDSLRLYNYLNSTKHPSGYILPTRAKYGVKPAPVVASFSSRGPSKITPDIIKPDITAPGVGIIASFSPAANPTGSDDDDRHSSFDFLSGTSMSCPHISGVIGLLKNLHPDWSPAALRSAIMTTAQSRDNTKKPIQDEYNSASPYDIGAGLVTPNQAADPGLVYDLTIEDHLNLLCSVGYTEKYIRLFSGRPYQCPENASITGYNYPSITFPIRYGSVSVTRKLKNVGTPGSYVAHVSPINGVTFSVEPDTLRFEKIGEEKSFKLSVEISGGDLKYAQFGELLWTDGEHYVRSPLVVGIVH